MIYSKRVYYKTNTNIFNQNYLQKIKKSLIENDILITKVILIIFLLIIILLINIVIFNFYSINNNKIIALQEDIKKINTNIESLINKKENLINDKKIKDNIQKKGYIIPNEKQIVRLKE